MQIFARYSLLDDNTHQDHLATLDANGTPRRINVKLDTPSGPCYGNFWCGSAPTVSAEQKDLPLELERLTIKQEDWIKRMDKLDEIAAARGGAYANGCLCCVCSMIPCGIFWYAKERKFKILRWINDVQTWQINLNVEVLQAHNMFAKTYTQLEDMTSTATGETSGSQAKVPVRYICIALTEEESQRLKSQPYYSPDVVNTPGSCFFPPSDGKCVYPA
jgi:hypothetical protein